MDITPEIDKVPGKLEKNNKKHAGMREYLFQKIRACNGATDIHPLPMPFTLKTRQAKTVGPKNILF